MTEAKLFEALYRLVYATPHTSRRPRELYDDRWVVMVHLWGVIHDRPQSWACDADNWPDDLLAGRPLISQSRLSRRLRTLGVQQLVERLLSAASALFPTPLAKAIDSKPLTVGAYSKDADAHRGRLAGGQFGRGYRLHAVMHGRVVRHWMLLPLSAHDAIGAARLLPRLEGGGYVIADNAYDSNDNHAIAAAANHQLLAPARTASRDVRDAAHNRPERLRALDMLHGPAREVRPALGVRPAALRRAPADRVGVRRSDDERTGRAAGVRPRAAPRRVVGGRKTAGLHMPHGDKTKTYEIDA
jgi:hypothetical protein